jgi:hypothetical protein
VILWYPCPESWRQIREFLGTEGFCRLWIPGSSVTAGPLYVALKGNPIGPLHWGPDQEDTFQKVKRHLGEAPALAVQDITCPLHRYIHEKGGIGLGVLTQSLGPWNQPLTSKKLDPVASGWPPILPGIGSSGPLNARSR